VQIIEKSLRGKVTNQLVNFLCVIAQRNRLNELANIYEVYRYLVDQKSGLRSVHISTAVELDDSTRSTIHKTLENYYKSKLKIYYKVDSALIGGILIKSEGREIDTTLIKKLRRIRLQMLKKKIFGEKYYEN
ncbi:MAG: ATP synthase F1 subunit delta, partial [Leptonema sp. (in: Bacteria)]|nr:ATP synthase F1 subunit delta [Leptonema sp. (in: bacteria)]